ncbi:dTDP-glucose 4,6-dehydratase [Luteithermobacter gelatinilyticus]|uniref:dTDP-glucose 4,6-dehydratase n=1 Tax=Luteithermobacter gelatinilyticus TaxID=2582913 RepID=UPI001106B1CF|nr:dTDP-glucose 4,6-dehydratase [Luteithermobacter gelatinilyticus]
MVNFLVTGGAGFIGSNFVHYMRKRRPEDNIIVLDALTYAGNKKNLDAIQADENFSFIHGDICDTALVENILIENDIDTIVHFAAESHVDRSIEGPDVFLQTNIVGTHSLLKAAKKVWLDEKGKKDHRFHHVSTDEVYGTLSPDDPAFSETTPYAPNSPYSASKAASDHLVRAYHHTYGLNTTISNCSNNYGPYQFPEKLIPLFILNVLHGRPLTIYGDGQQIRDWLHVEDHCRGIELILDKGKPGEVYNIGGNSELTNLFVVDTLCNAIDEAFEKDETLRKRFPDAPCSKGKPSQELKVYVKDRPGHDRRYAINASKIEKELGYKPVHTFEAGFFSTLEWYLNNEKWWQEILDGSYRE